MKDHERDELRKTILEFLSRGRVCWTDLKKRVLGSCKSFATDCTFSRQISYLEEARCVRKLGAKGSRAPYEITDKGRRLLAALQSEN